MREKSTRTDVFTVITERREAIGITTLIGILLEKEKEKGVKK